MAFDPYHLNFFYPQWTPQPFPESASNGGSSSANQHHHHQPWGPLHQQGYGALSMEGSRSSDSASSAPSSQQPHTPVFPSFAASSPGPTDVQQGGFLPPPGSFAANAFGFGPPVEFGAPPLPQPPVLTIEDGSAAGQSSQEDELETKARMLRQRLESAKANRAIKPIRKSSSSFAPASPLNGPSLATTTTKNPFINPSSEESSSLPPSSSPAAPLSAADRLLTTRLSTLSALLSSTTFAAQKSASSSALLQANHALHLVSHTNSLSGLTKQLEEVREKAEMWRVLGERGSHVKTLLEERERRREEEEMDGYGRSRSGAGGGSSKKRGRGRSDEGEIDMEDVQVGLKLLGFLTRMHNSWDENAPDIADTPSPFDNQHRNLNHKRSNNNFPATSSRWGSSASGNGGQNGNFRPIQQAQSFASVSSLQSPQQSSASSSKPYSSRWDDPVDVNGSGSSGPRNYGQQPRKVSRTDAPRW